MKLEELRAALEAHDVDEKPEAPKTPRPDPSKTESPAWAELGVTVVQTEDGNAEALRAAITCERCGRKRAFFRDVYARVYVVEPCRPCAVSGNPSPA